MLSNLLFMCFAVGSQSAPEKRYSFEAEVISVDAPGLLVVKHGETPGLMPAMTMNYAVADASQIEPLKPRDKISTVLVVSEKKGHLEKIALVQKADPAALPAPEGRRRP